jgi:hypothetical protein
MTLNTIVEFSKKNMEFFILAIYAYVLFQIEDNDYITMLLLTVAACLSICFLKKRNVVEGNSNTCGKLVEPMNCGDDGDEDEGYSNKEGFENSPKVVQQMPDMMGPYDGLCLQTGNNQYWMKSPDETALVPNDALFTYLSSQGPTKPVFSDNSSLNGPSIDGHPDSEKKMFMLANNRTSPNCCPSTFSTSTGCVCTTKNQRDFIASRGGANINKDNE